MAVFVRDVPSKKTAAKAADKGLKAEAQPNSNSAAGAEDSGLIDSAVSAILSPVSEKSFDADDFGARRNAQKAVGGVGAKEPVRIDEAEAKQSVAFALSIAKEMKQRSREEALQPKNAGSEIRLSKRPTTRERGQTTERFPDADLQEFRKRLLDAREKAMGGINAIKSTGFNATDDHEADGGDGTTQTLRLQALGQMGSFNRTIQQIEEALHRIEDGTYGVCTVCGQLIRKPRLVNQPFVLTCMECQSEMEKENLH